MGNGGDVWIPRGGLGLLAVFALTGLVGALVLANNGHDVPPWLSQTIGNAASTLGVIIIAIYGRGGSGGSNAGGSNGTRVAGPSGTSVSTSGIKTA